MKVSIRLLLLTLAAAAPAAFAQKADGDLSAAQAHGRQVFAQSCGICHLAPSLGAKTYGPVLNKGTVGGSDEAMRAIIANGTERMPAFKYYLNPSEIDAIIAYVRTVPTPVARAANEPQKASPVANAKGAAKIGESP
jgi:mono/diheme cytochrome c family protein